MSYATLARSIEQARESNSQKEKERTAKRRDCRLPVDPVFGRSAIFSPLTFAPHTGKLAPGNYSGTSASPLFSKSDSTLESCGLVQSAHVNSLSVKTVMEGFRPLVM